MTVSDTYAQSYIKKTSVEAGSAAKLAEEKKIRKYQHLIIDNDFAAIAMETVGSWGKDGLRLVRSVGQRITQRTEEKRATNFLIQKMSLINQKGNAISILGTIPRGQELDEIYYLL